MNDRRIEIDNNNLADNVIRLNVISPRNWLFSVSEAGARANAICLNIAETAKANGVDYYQYLEKLLIELPNLAIHRNSGISNQYMLWSKNIQATYANKIAIYQILKKNNDIRLFVMRTEKVCLFFITQAYIEESTTVPFRLQNENHPIFSFGWQVN